MNSSYVTRKEIARDLGIDPKTLRKRLSEAGILLGKGLIPAEKVKEIKLRLKVASQNQNNTVSKQ
jgi:transposase-like protein